MMHNILYYVAMVVLVVYAVVMGGAFALAVSDEDGEAKAILGGALVVTVSVVSLMVVYHG